MATILDIARRAAIRLSLRQPNTLFSAYDEGDTTKDRMREALTQTVRFLAKDYDWECLRAEHAFTTVAGEAQPAALPTDFLRDVSDTLIEVGATWFYSGPLDLNDWARRKLSGAFAYRYNDKVLQLTPPASAGVQMSRWYIRNSVCWREPLAPATERTRQSSFADDRDEPLWDEELILLGTIYHWRKMERSEYAQDEFDFQKCMADEIKRDGGRGILSLGKRAMTATDMLDQMRNAAIVIRS